MAEIVASKSKTLKFLKPEPRVTPIEFKFCLSKSLPKKLEIPELREGRWADEFWKQMRQKI